MSERGICSECGARAYHNMSTKCEQHRGLSTWKQHDKRAQQAAEVIDIGVIDSPTVEEVRPTSPYDPPTGEELPTNGTGARGVWNKIRARIRNEAPPSGHPKERTPKQRKWLETRGKRLSAAQDIGSGFASIGSMVASSPRYFPIGRYLQVAAPSIGVDADQAVADTFVDKVAVQPGLRTREKFDPIIGHATVGFLMFRICQDPDRINGPEGYMLANQIRHELPALAHGFEVQEAHEEEIAEAIEKLSPILFPDTEEERPPVDPFVGAILGRLFAPPTPPQPAPTPESQEAGF